MPTNPYQFVDRDQAMKALANCAAEFTNILAREVSGERDGDEYWHGSDATDAALMEIEPRMHELAEIYRQATAAQPEIPI
jgi:hypothetical protein